ncbi:MAG: histidinol-phosphate transaminase [Bacteroides sp.]|nr:histidinol-phosphate transaminase [Eubacterium sp.]MCM1418359.1 histidinol-phosphate transaminase [Roseburia sp.]MCM1462841.1 histidinol-phosphate transaminase [Bacteroides sp.]
MWEENVRRVTPYIPGEQPRESGIVKLNTNESPYPPSPEVARVLAAYDGGALRLYPDPDSTVLVGALAERYGVDPRRVFVGVGSDDVLSMAFLTFFASRRPILFPDVTYSFYDVWAAVYGIAYETVPLTKELRIDPADYRRENGGIVLANPNAPTGVYEPVALVEEIVRANPRSVVIADEAYIDFGGESCLPLTEKYENLLVVRTFSKSRSLAGLRIGFAIGSERLIKYLNDVKFSVNSYTMNPLAQLCGAAAVRDEAYFIETTGRIVETRETAKKRLAALGFSFPDSMTNFLFASHKSVPARAIFEALKKRKIYVRYWDKPRIDNALRITVGTPDEMEALYHALGEIV